MEAKKPCFGKIEDVFPLGPDGLREVPASCFECPSKTECLRAALASQEGLALKEERIRQAEQKGIVGWLKRWSELKSLAKDKEKIKKGSE
jgi:hypothetical protein